MYIMQCKSNTVNISFTGLQYVIDHVYTLSLKEMNVREVNLKARALTVPISIIIGLARHFNPLHVGNRTLWELYR